MASKALPAPPLREGPVGRRADHSLCRSPPPAEGVAPAPGPRSAPARRRLWPQEVWAVTRKRSHPSRGVSSEGAAMEIRRLRADLESLRDFTYTLTERVSALESASECQAEEPALLRALPEGSAGAAARNIAEVEAPGRGGCTILCEACKARRCGAGSPAWPHPASRECWHMCPACARASSPQRPTPNKPPPTPPWLQAAAPRARGLGGRVALPPGRPVYQRRFCALARGRHCQGAAVPRHHGVEARLLGPRPDNWSCRNWQRSRQAPVPRRLVPAATLAPACQRQWASRSRRGHGASRVDRGVWRVVANVALPIAGHTKVRPRWCHGQRRLRPNRCPPLYSVPRPAQCHHQLPLCLNRCPQWPACHLLAGHLLQPNCRPQCHNTRLLRLTPTLRASRDGSHDGPHSSTTHSATTPPTYSQSASKPYSKNGIVQL